ncbi:MAG: hypothetical protein MJ154_00795 [Candidatus Saccharibacteria bacterium]|nr:hypothetical protein [Candidatus Saccharibacteria bacterium]
MKDMNSLFVQDSFSVSENKPKTHGAFGFCHSWGKNVIIEKPTRYSQATRDFLNQRITKNLIRETIDSSDISTKKSVLETLAYVVYHDSRYLYSITSNISDKKCIVLTNYQDTIEFFEKNTINGVSNYGTTKWRNHPDWPEVWRRDGGSKPLLMNFEAYCTKFSRFHEIPVHIVDIPNNDKWLAFERCMPLVSELHIYPLMGTLFSCLLRMPELIQNMSEITRIEKPILSSDKYISQMSEITDQLNEALGSAIREVDNESYLDKEILMEKNKLIHELDKTISYYRESSRILDITSDIEILRTIVSKVMRMHTLAESNYKEFFAATKVSKYADCAIGARIKSENRLYVEIRDMAEYRINEKLANKSKEL